MLTDMRSSQLILLKQSLEQCTNIVSSALAVRSSLIDLKSQNAMLNAEIDSKNDPETFYKFRLFNIGISIIKWNYQNGYGLCFHIKCYNCKIKTFESGVYKQDYDITNTFYGNYNTIEEAIIWYQRAILSYLAEKNNITLQYELEIF